MATNDYYRNSPVAQTSQPPQQDRPLSHVAFAYNPYSSSSTVDRQSRLSQAYRPNSPYYESHDPSRLSQYSDSIPLKHKSKINTLQDGDDWRNQSIQYPSSPDSQTPQLLPKSNGKKKKNRGFFSGKIPWFVYTLSLVQITVFIAEIIKNCKSTTTEIGSNVANNGQRSLRDLPS